MKKTLTTSKKHEAIFDLSWEDIVNTNTVYNFDIGDASLVSLTGQYPKEQRKAFYEAHIHEMSDNAKNYIRYFLLFNRSELDKLVAKYIKDADFPKLKTKCRKHWHSMYQDMELLSKTFNGVIFNLHITSNNSHKTLRFIDGYKYD